MFEPTPEELERARETVRQMGLPAPDPEVVPVVLTLDGTDFLVDVTRLVPPGTPPERLVAAVMRVAQGCLTRSEVVALRVVGGPSVLVNWRAVKVVGVRLP